jgi:hypothetical protein
LSSKNLVRVLPRRPGARGSKSSVEDLGDTPIGRLADFAVNEKRFCIGFALVLVPWPWQADDSGNDRESKNAWFIEAIAAFSGVDRIVDDRYPARVRSSDPLGNSDRLSA